MTAQVSQPNKRRPRTAWFALGGAAVFASLTLAGVDIAAYAWIPVAAFLVHRRRSTRPT
jgi:hypothetical protein